MARTKQTKPVERPPSAADVQRAEKTNGALSAPAQAAVLPLEEKDAGVVQLVIAVAGIYGSLCVPPRRARPRRAKSLTGPTA